MEITRFQRANNRTWTIKTTEVTTGSVSLSDISTLIVQSVFCLWLFDHGLISEIFCPGLCWSLWPHAFTNEWIALILHPIQCVHSHVCAFYMLRTWFEIEFLPYCRFSLRRKHKTCSKPTEAAEKRVKPDDADQFQTDALSPSLSSSSLCSAVSGNDHQAEADRAAGAVPLLPRRGGGDLGVGLLALQPAAGPQGDLQLRENSGGALPRRQPDWGAAQGNATFSSQDNAALSWSGLWSCWLVMETLG